MNGTATVESPSYRESLQLILNAHARMRAGSKVKPTPEQQETIEGAWDELRPEEQERLWGLSADLYQFQGTEKLEPPTASNGPRELLVHRIGEAMGSGRWEQALRLLRLGPKELSQAQIAVFRGRAWQNLGHDEVALLFYDFAAGKELGDPVPAILALHTLFRLRRLEEAVARASRYASDPNTSPNLLFKSADVLLAAALDSSGQERAKKYQQVINLLQTAMRREQDSTGRIGPFTSRGYAQLGLCYQLLDQHRNASGAYDQAVELMPTDAAVRVARGVFRYETDRDAAAEDFERAAALGTSLVWPYFYLAHRAFRENDHTRFAAMYIQAMERARSPVVLAKLLEWWAITLTQLRGPDQDALEFLSKAVELNPADQKAHHNLRRLQELLSHPESQDGNWEDEEFPASSEARTFLASPEAMSLAA